MLVSCPKCGKSISSYADACPACGTSPKAIVCQNCKSEDVVISVQTVGETTVGKSETRKKSAVTRAGNKAGRAGMIMMTGGLWALTPKKSEYQDKVKMETSYRQVKMCVCQKCGNSWEMR